MFFILRLWWEYLTRPIRVVTPDRMKGMTDANSPERCSTCGRLTPADRAYQFMGKGPFYCDQCINETCGI